MDANTIQAYAPYIVIVVMFLVQNRIFVTPEQLEKKHREILEDIKKDYVTKTEVTALNDSVNDIKDKTDKIYDIIITEYATKHQ